MIESKYSKTNVRRYIGLVIGGSCDGQMLESGGPNATVHKPLPLDVTYTHRGALEDKPYVRGVREDLRYVEMHSASEAGDKQTHGFWVPVKEFDNAHMYIMNALIEKYRKRER